MLSPPKAILFDLDGTLVDSALDFYSIINDLRAEQHKPALPEPVIRAQVSHGGMAMARLILDQPDLANTDPLVMDTRQALLDRYEHTAGQHSTLFDGCQALIDSARQQGISWGIVTNKPRRYTEILLARMGIDSPVVVCPDDVKHSKPHPEPLLVAASALNIAPDDCWYLGDHLRDIEAANAANMTSIAVRFGYLSDTDNPDDWHADRIIDHPQELLPYLRAETK